MEGRTHPLGPSLRLAEWIISGNTLDPQVYRESLRSSFWHHGERYESQYSSAWRKWDSWCCSRSINPVSSSIANICDFLTELYHDGMSYATINTHRSAISMTHIPIDGNRTGSHFLVQRFTSRGVQLTSTSSAICFYVACRTGSTIF